MAADKRELLKGSTPMLVLAVLREAPRHGYAIAREIERRSASALRFKEGTLYPTLYGLEEQGFLVGEWQKSAEGRERRIYHITPQGLAEMDKRVRLWNEFAAAIESVIGGTGHDGVRESPGVAERPDGRNTVPEPAG